MNRKDEFFALPEAPLGLALRVDEGAPLYVDNIGYMWSLQRDYNGQLCREMLV